MIRDKSALRSSYVAWLRSRTFVLARNAILASSVVAVAAGCAERAYAGPPSVEGTLVVAGPAPDDGDVVYVDALPVVDIEAYPAVEYGGVSVYYVDGRWYQHGGRGWGYYRQEPPELGRQRQEHLRRDHDPRWADHQPGTEHRGQDERIAPVPRPGVTEAQPAERRAQPEQPRREAAPAPQPVAQARHDDAPAPPPQAQRRDRAPSPRPTKVPARSAPVHTTERQPEHR